MKNIPDEWTSEETVVVEDEKTKEKKSKITVVATSIFRKTFEAFGKISSLYCEKNSIGTYAFICYGSDDTSDREYGPRCATKAVEAMNNKEYGGKILYVTPALTKSEREKELAHETLKYKNSKKRCNLYVKNFTAETTEEDLRNLFSHYGEIESLKLFGQKDNKSPFAFVCFKTPDTASQVKNANLHINQRPLYINHYEMKQQRDILNETNKDKQDWQRYQAENFQSFDYQSTDQISSLLRLLMHSVQKHNGGLPMQRTRSAEPMGQQNYQGGNQGGHQGGYNNRQNNYSGSAPRT